MTGIDPQRSGCSRRRPDQVALVGVGHAAVLVNHGALEVEADRLAEIRDGLVIIALVELGVGSLEISGGILRVGGAALPWR